MLNILIRDGRIEAIGSGITAPAGGEDINATGRHVLPGMIDDQAHFCEPRLTNEGGIATESSAALAGGKFSDGLRGMKLKFPSKSNRWFGWYLQV